MNAKRLIAASLAFLIAFPAINFSANSQKAYAADSEIGFTEDFESFKSGEAPSGIFQVSKSGDSDVAVVEKPSKDDKSLYLRNFSEGNATIETPVSNPDNIPLTLNFNFMLSSADTLSFPTVYDSQGNKCDILKITNGVLEIDEKKVDIALSKWHTAEIKFNFEKNYFRFTLDGEEVTRRALMDVKEISKLEFSLQSTRAGIYLDDIHLYVPTSDSNAEWWPSYMYFPQAIYDEADDVLFGALAMYAESNVAYMDGVKLITNVVPKEIDKKMFVPLRFTAENMGADVVWNPADGSVNVTYFGKNILVKPASAEATVDGETKALISDVRVIDGSTYILAEDIAALMSEPVYVEDGFVYMCADSKYLLAADDRTKEEVIHRVKYYRPSGDEVYNNLISTHPNKSHPRIMGTKADFEKLSYLWQNDEFAKSALDSLKLKADSMIPTTPIKQAYESGSTRLLQDDVLLKRVEYLSFIYYLTKDEKYAKRAWNEIECLSGYTDFNPQHYLDTAVYTEACAYAYDWLYDWLDENQKATIREMIIEKSLKVALYVYRGGGDDEAIKALNPRMGWCYNAFNWNIHCNLGTLLGAFAICDDVDEDTLNNIIKPIMGYAFRSLELHFDEWAPDGAWQEGPGYGQATLSMDVQFLEMIADALGTDYGYSNIRGMREAIYFFYTVQGPQGTFNYADADQIMNPQFVFSFWMAKQLNEKGVGAERVQTIKDTFYTGLTPLDMLYYDPAYCDGELSSMELDKYFRKSEVASMRSSWRDDGMYVGFLAGDNKAPHSQLDTGTYVLDWNNVRWATELGKDPISYTTDGNQRTYPARAEGHNTIVIDNTPYATFVDEDGWSSFIHDTYDDMDIGIKPLGYTVTETVPLNQVGGSARVDWENPDEESGNKVLRIICPQAGWGEANTGAHANIQFEAPRPSNAVEVSFRIKPEINTNTVSLGTIYGDDGTGARGHMSFGWFDKDGNVKLSNGGTNTSVMRYGMNTWYDVKFVVDFKAQKYDAYINGEQVASKFGFPAAIYDIMTYRWQYSGHVTKAAIDDVKFRAHPDDMECVASVKRKYDQYELGAAYIDKFVSKPRGAYAITDMTEAYKGWADSAVRGVMLTNDRSAFVVRDEVKASAKSDIYWFSHSVIEDIDVAINPDGKSAILTSKKNGSRMWVGIISDTDAKMELLDTTPLEGSPNPETQTTRFKFQKIGIKFEGVDGIELSVAYVPLSHGQNVPDFIPEALSIAEFDIPDGEIPKADTITVDGKQIDGFDPAQTVYNVLIEEGETIPVIGASYNGKAVNVSQATSLPGSASFTLEAEGGSKVTYNVNVSVRQVVKTTIQGYPITEDNILTSSIQQPENPPKATIDGDNQTRWAAEGYDEWIIYDFGQQRAFSKLDLGWYKGETRKYTFKIELSSDAVNWTTVFDGTNSGTTGEPETYSFDTINARYLRIIAYGNNENLWNNIAEVR
ncbi:MAG: discoidin domain-containing protein [Clostridia bacterium]|nr:discoidin domain-containing protein [Clostridia bacterium]